MPSAYIISNIRVTDPAQYEEYKKLSTLAMQAHVYCAGRYGRRRMSRQRLLACPHFVAGIACNDG